MGRSRGERYLRSPQNSGGHAPVQRSQHLRRPARNAQAGGHLLPRSHRTLTWRETMPAQAARTDMTPPVLSITSWMRTRRPNHGCHSYKTSRSAIPWAFRRRILQHEAPALPTRRADTGSGLVRPLASEGRSGIIAMPCGGFTPVRPKRMVAERVPTPAAVKLASGVASTPMPTVSETVAPGQ